VSLSRLLLVAASSKKYIAGKGNDKVIIKPLSRTFMSGNDPYTGEVILFFQLDDPRDQEKLVSRSLGMQANDKRCDGLIFYAQDEEEEKVICLVEMKSTNIGEAAQQIKSTKNHIQGLLREECDTHCHRQLQRIKWKASFYHHGASQDEVASVLKQLKKEGFADYNDFTPANNDIGPLLRGKMSAKEMANKYKHRKL